MSSYKKWLKINLNGEDIDEMCSDMNEHKGNEPLLIDALEAEKKPWLLNAGF